MRGTTSPETDPSEPGAIPIESLLRELDDFDRIDIDSSGSDDAGPWHDGREGPREVLSAVVNTLFPDTDFRFDEDLVKQNLDETLLMLVSLRESGTHGKGLMDDLARLFDAHLSPGTVYPQLHELEEEGLLRMVEKVRTKEYHVGDDREVRARLERNMYQHLALGYAIYLCLEDRRRSRS
ncbi:MAG: helix-turn-helix transcriptional regulator [Haloarculaceae archaeon]